MGTASKAAQSSYLSAVFFHLCICLYLSMEKFLLGRHRTTMFSQSVENKPSCSSLVIYLCVFYYSSALNHLMWLLKSLTGIFTFLAQPVDDQ